MLGDARAEAGRADHGAVGAGQAPVRDLRPARVLELRLDSLAEALDRQRVAHQLPGANRDGRGIGLLLAGRRGQLHPSEELAAGNGAGPHHETVVQLGHGKVVAGMDVRTGPHRTAETGGRRGRALDRDDERGEAAGHEVVVDERALGQHAILDPQRGDVTGTDAEEREPRHLRLRRLEDEGIPGPTSAAERDHGREGVALPARRGGRVVECPRRPVPEPVVARALLVGHALGQVRRTLDLVVDDRAVLDGGRDDLATLGPQLLDQSVELPPRKPEGTRHQRLTRVRSCRRDTRRAVAGGSRAGAGRRPPGPAGRRRPQARSPNGPSLAGGRHRTRSPSPARWP